MDLKEWVEAAPGYLRLVSRGRLTSGENELRLLAGVKWLVLGNVTF